MTTRIEAIRKRVEAATPEYNAKTVAELFAYDDAQRTLWTYALPDLRDLLTLYDAAREVSREARDLRMHGAVERLRAVLAHLDAEIEDPR